MVDHLSYSQLSMFTSCPRRYWFNYIKEAKKEQRHWVFEIGTAYHLAIESLYRERNLNLALQAYNSYLQAYIDDQGGVTDLKEEEKIRLEDAVKYYYDNIFPMYESLSDTIEDSGEFYIDGIDIPISYRIDLSTIDGRIIDHKTVGGSEPHSNFNKQLLLYAYAYYLKHGRVPQSIELHKAYKNPRKLKGNPDALPVVVQRQGVDFAEVLKVVAEMRAMYNSIKADLFPPKVGRHCWKCPHLEACNDLIIKEES